MSNQPRAPRGQLTVFFGAAPGVGKTHAMLAAAHEARAQGRDVVVGAVDTHARPEIEARIADFERVASASGDVNLDATLARRPALVLVDALAHENAPGARHRKRWQDVEELLDAGISVFTTLDVLHIESLHDVVAQVTGLTVRALVPDRLLEQAEELRLVDLPPAELMRRVREGKVQLGTLPASFFTPGNLSALRELALRRAAEHVDAQMHAEQRAAGVENAWPVTERVIVCVSPSPASERLVRSARRIAATLRAPWIAAYVETPAHMRMARASVDRVAGHLRMAEALGADTVRLTGENAAREIIHHARRHNVTRIVVGKPTHPRWRDLVRPSFLEEVVRATPDIDVHVISGEAETDAVAAAATGAEAGASRTPFVPGAWRGFAVAALAVVLSTTAAWVCFGRRELADVVMTFLLGVVLVSMRFGHGPSMLTIVLSVLSYDFFFVPPYFTLDVTDFRHIVTFGVMFVVGMVISKLTQRVRDHADAARRREARSAQLYAISRELTRASTVDDVVAVALIHLRAAFAAEATVLLPDAQNGFLAVAKSGSLVLSNDDDDVRDWVWQNDKSAGRGTDTRSTAGARYMPLRGARDKVGVLAIRPEAELGLVDPEQRRLLDAFTSQIASALERIRFADDAKSSEIAAEAERLRSALLSSVSHDLRTPLGVIQGATSTLLQDEASLSVEARRDLVETAHEEAERMTRLVRNLLDMTRVASGAVRPTKQWHPIDEIVGSALHRLEARLGDREVLVSLPRDLPPVPLDDVLVEQVLINLLENAIKYTPRGTRIDIEARFSPAGGRAGAGEMEVEIADRGPGVPRAERDHVFEKFYRLKRERSGGGAGLGLAICRGLVEAHGGRLWVDDREGGGSRFRFTLPIEGEPPVISTAEDA